MSQQIFSPFETLTIHLTSQEIVRWKRYLWNGQNLNLWFSNVFNSLFSFADLQRFSFDKWSKKADLDADFRPWWGFIFRFCEGRLEKAKRKAYQGKKTIFGSKYSMYLLSRIWCSRMQSSFNLVLVAKTVKHTYNCHCQWYRISITNLTWNGSQSQISKPTLGDKQLPMELIKHSTVLLKWFGNNSNIPIGKTIYWQEFFTSNLNIF